MSGWIRSYLWVFFVSLGLSYIGTFIISVIVRKMGILDYPDERKIHLKPTPRLGGVPIYIAYVVAITYACPHSPQERGIMLGGLLPLFIGMVDDIKRIPATVKLLSLVLGTLILWHYGIRLSLFRIEAVNLIFTILWIVGLTSAFNAIDNMDGLAAGVAFIASSCYFVVAVQTFQWWWGALAVAIMGSSLGFLKHNFKPARIFLGDSGSFFLGFTLAAMGVMGGWSAHPVKASIIPILILGVPIFDLSYVIVARRLSGLTESLRDVITFSGRDHFSHRLVELGLSERKAVLFIYLVSVCVGIGAIVLRNARRIDAMLLLSQFLIIFSVIIILMRLAKRKANV